MLSNFDGPRKPSVIKCLHGLFRFAEHRVPRVLSVALIGTLGDLVSKETACCVGGKVKH